MSRLSVVAAAFLLAVPTYANAQGLIASTAQSGSDAAIFETKDAAVLTAGMSPLAKSPIKKNEREIRIWYSGFGNPQYLVIIKQKGASTTGRLLLWWDQYYLTTPDKADTRVDNFVRAGFDCGPIAKRNSEYGEDRWISSVCEAKLKGTPDWKEFLAEVESHSLKGAPIVQTASEEAADAEPENWGITVERRSGLTYGVSHYHTALTFGTPEPGRGPKLQDMVNALAATVRLEPSLAQTR